MNEFAKTQDFLERISPEQPKLKMKNPMTSTWKMTTSQKSSFRLKMRKETLVSISTRELVEFCWSKHKQFSGSYSGFPVEVT